MARLTLPRRAHGSRRAFWLVGSAGLGLLTGLVTAGAGRDRRRLLVALPVAAAIAAPGLRWPREVVDLPYRAWNRLARLVSDLLTAYLTRIGFEVLKAEQRRDPAGAVPMSPQSHSGWRPRASQTAAAYRFQDTDAVDHGNDDPFARFVARSGNEWARSLRPVVRLLAAVDADRSQSSRPPSDVYTLY